MKTRTRQNRLTATLAGLISMFVLLSAQAQTYIWADNAQGQLYLTCPGPVTFNYYWPSNGNWTQSYQTNGNCNNTAVVESAPSNWDPVDTNTPALGVGVYPGGPGAVGASVILGPPANTFLGSGAHLNLYDLTILAGGALSVGANWSVALNQLEFQGDGQITSGVGGFLVGNGGAIIKSGGTNTFAIVNPTIAGTNLLVEVDSGTLILPSTGVTIDGATFAISNNATLLLTADSNAEPSLSGNITGVGGGTVLFTIGALTSSGCDLNLPGSMFQWTGGSLKSGPFTNSGIINITSVGPQFYGGATLYNYNLVNLAPNSGLDFFSSGGAAPGLFNEAGATFNIQGDDSITTGSGSIYNFGLFIKSAGAGLSQITPVFNNQGGTIEVDSGIMDINIKGGGSFSNVTFVVSNAATLLFLTNNLSVEIEGAVTGSGGGTVFMDNGLAASAFQATLNFPGSMFQWAGGRLGSGGSSVPLTNLGTINITGPVAESGTIANNSVIIQSGAGSVGSTAGFSGLNNNAGAIYDIQNDNGIAMTTFNNYGLFKKSAGTGTSLVTGNHFNDFGPGGVVEADSGALAFGGNNNYFFTNTLFVVSNGASVGLSISNNATEIEGSLTGSGGGTVFMNNGTVLSSFPTTLNFPGAMFQWQGGKLGSAGSSPLTNLGTITVSAPVSISGTLANNGTMLQTGAGTVGNNATLNNNGGAVYQIENDNGISLTTFNNYGLFKKSAGAGTSLMTGNHFNDFGPSGAVEVDSGTLAFGGNNNYFFTNTSFVVSSGASVGLSISNNATEIEGSLTGSGGGTVFMNNGTVLSSFPTTLNFPGAMFQWQGGKLGSAGSSPLTNLGTITVSAPVSISGTLANNGTMLQTGAGTVGNNATLNNNGGAVYQIENDNGISLTTFNNYGLFKKSAGAGTSLMTGNHFNDFGPSGAVEVDSGTLAFGGNNNYFFTNTSFVVSSGASVGLSISNNATEIEGSLTGSGGGTVFMNNGTVSSSFPTTLNFPGAMFQWQGGKLGSAGSSPLTNLGTITVSGPVSLIGTLANNGTMIQTGTGIIGNNSTLNNNAGAVYQIQNDNGLPIGIINNYGLFEKTGGTGISYITPTFNNSGMIQAASGMLLFTNGTFVQNAGTLQLSASVSCQGAIQENGGTITGVGPMGNTGTITMTVNGGVIAPGNPFGVLSWIGRSGFSMGSAAAFSVVLGGPGQYGQLQVPNTSAALAGTLNVTLTNGYAPAIGTQFQIISTSLRGGTFSKLNVPAGISVNYSNNGVYLVVTAPVTVQINQPQVLGTNFTFNFGTVTNRNYVIQQNTDLTTTNWTPFTNFTGDGSVFHFATPVTSLPQLFFRVEEP